jgi:hypothetical protein
MTRTRTRPRIAPFLPRALVRPSDAFAATPIAGASLTLATLRALEGDGDDDNADVEEIVMSISGDRAFFHKVPGVMR